MAKLPVAVHAVKKQVGRLAKDKLKEAHGVAPVVEHGSGVAELHLG